MELLVLRHVTTESLDKDGLEITKHQIVLNGSQGDVKVQLVINSTELGQIKDMVPIERGMPFELDV